METLQILGWIYLGVAVGSIGGVIGLGLFQVGRVTSLQREINDLKEDKRLLISKLEKSYKEANHNQEKEEIGRKSQSKNR